MTGLSTESTPRERLARALVLARRARRFRGSSIGILAAGLVLSLVAALCTRRIYRSETTVLCRDGIQTQRADGESTTARAARLGPRLRDLLYARPRLSQVIEEHGLFPEKVRKSMLDAIEEMTAAVGFRARAGDSYVISFTYDDPAVARDVAAQLAALMMDAYNRENLDTATLTRDFLERKQAEADAGVDEASHKLAEFLADHPQFQWGVNDSPYAPVPGPGAGAAVGTGAGAASPRRDPALAALEQALARVEAELSPGEAPRLPGAPPSEAQARREAAAAELAAAEKALAEKLLTVKPAHPDAVAAESRVRSARRALATADAALVPRARPETSPSLLAPGRRAELEREQASLRRQITDRQGSIARAAPRSEGPQHPSKEPVHDTVELETEWHRLRLDLDRAREKLHTIQQTARAADLSADAVAKQGHEEMVILEPAYLPVRPERGRGRVFFAGAAMALFLALGYAASRVLLDDTLLDEGDVAALGGPAVLVAMPHLDPAPAAPPRREIVPSVRYEEDPDDDDPPPPSSPVPSERGMVLRPSHSIVEAVFDDPEVEVIGTDLPPDGACRLGPAPPLALASLRVLRHRLEQRRGDGSFVVSVMSPGPGEGKTTLALRLAVTLSEADRARVILVEGNFERPRLATRLGLKLPAEAGFSTQIHERMRGRGLAWGIVRLGSSLSLLAEPEEEAAHPEAIHSTHLEAALSALRRSYDYVVIDGPAVVGSGNANVLEEVSDTVLLLVRAGETKGAALSRAVQQLGDRRVLGVVLNDATSCRPSRASPWASAWRSAGGRS